LGPYVLPADTTVFTNLFRIMRNPKDFLEPDTFRPERFINEKGEFVRNEKVVAFSIGEKTLCHSRQTPFSNAGRVHW
jgi:cytochrome P450 family 2 subfamily U polypeptide 1